MHVSGSERQAPVNVFPLALPSFNFHGRAGGAERNGCLRLPTISSDAFGLHASGSEGQAPVKVFHLVLPRFYFKGRGRGGGLFYQQLRT